MILREDNVEYSLLRKIREGLTEMGYQLSADPTKPEPGDQLFVRESFPTPEERTRELTLTTLAFGFAIDDGGRSIELGSTLTEFKHTLTCWVFGTEPHLARQIANAVKHIMRHEDDTVELLNFEEDPPVQIDVLRVEKTQTQHQGNSSKRPWDQYVWTTSIVVSDAYYV